MTTPISLPISQGCGCYSRKCSFNVLNGPEARPEGRGQTTPTPAPPYASRTTFLNQMHTGHRKSTGSPQTIPQKTHTTVTTPKRTRCVCKNSPSTAHTTANLTTCVGRATPLLQQFAFTSPLSSFLSTRRPHNHTGVF